MMAKKRNLDFTILPKMSSAGVFFCFDKELETELNDGPFQEVYERSQAVLMFFYHAKSENEPWENSAYLRAGLNEFYSLEDASRRDCKLAGIQKKPAMIRESKNPLIHLMYLLRHVNVHAQISKTDIHNSKVISTLAGITEEIELKNVILSQSTLAQIQRCKEAKDYYNPDQLFRASQWLDEKQYNFGIGEVFRKGVSAYCRELLQSVG